MTVHIIGSGLADGATLTVRGRELLDAADVIIGAQRLVDSCGGNPDAKRHATIVPDEIARICKAHEGQCICVLMSGDTGFYSGTTKLLGALSPNNSDVEIVPGISSIQALAARERRPWQGWRLVSAHGRGCDPIAEVRDHAETFFLTGGGWTVSVIVSALADAGFGSCIATVGEKLGSPEERVTTDTVENLVGREFASLSVLLIDNPFVNTSVFTGIPDLEFYRGKAPMTKSEVRAVVLSKMRLSEGSVVWDIGAGSGSVSVEAALSARRGHVYAVECDEEACEIIETNRLKFRVANLDVIQGLAPEACEDLPSPDVVFIGGSKGNLKQIIERVIAKSSHCRIVATAVTLETIAEAIRVFADLAIEDYEAVSVSVARTKELGSYHMLMAQNPIMVFSGTLQYRIRE